VEGSIRKAGSRLRVTAQLIDTDSGNHVWSERYDRELQDVFAIQDELTATIVGAVAGKEQAADISRVRFLASSTFAIAGACFRSFANDTKIMRASWGKVPIRTRGELPRARKEWDCQEEARRSELKYCESHTGEGAGGRELSLSLQLTILAFVPPPKTMSEATGTEDS
jgi:hypothetical protein